MGHNLQSFAACRCVCARTDFGAEYVGKNGWR